MTGAVGNERPFSDHGAGAVSVRSPSTASDSCQRFGGRCAPSSGSVDCWPG